MMLTRINCMVRGMTSTVLKINDLKSDVAALSYFRSSQQDDQ